MELIDPAKKMVRGKTLKGEAFELPYDKLLISTGASPIMPDLPGFDLPGVMTLKTLEDGRKVKQFIHDQNVRKAIILGMGYIALEMCEALHERNIEVHMVKPRPVFLPWMHEKLADMVKEEIESNGINVHLGHEVKRIEKKDGIIQAVCSDLTLEGQMVLVAIGIIPNSQLAEKAGLELGPEDRHCCGQGASHFRPAHLCSRRLCGRLSCGHGPEDMGSPRFKGQQGRLGGRR